MLMWVYPTDSITDRWKLCELNQKPESTVSNPEPTTSDNEQAEVQKQGLNDFGHPSHLEANPKHYKILEECWQIFYD